MRDTLGGFLVFFTGFTVRHLLYRIRVQTSGRSGIYN